MSTKFQMLFRILQTVESFTANKLKNNERTVKHGILNIYTFTSFPLKVIHRVKNKLIFLE